MMANEDQIQYTIERLIVAYRKAKVDFYYSSHAILLDIAEYEENLIQNLESLLIKININDMEWIKEKSFLGDWIPAPKSIKPVDDDSNEGLIVSSPDDLWRSRYIVDSEVKGAEKACAEFRLMARPSIDFHVLSALWMLEVGSLYDKKISNCAYGSRLRRQKNGEVNELSLGSFVPYLRPFRTWRDNGINVMRTELAAKKKIVALTADISSFYHKLDPEFMLNEQFNEMVGIELEPLQKRLHVMFITALQAWAQNAPLKKGLPVGLPASAVVANSALIELDYLIEKQVAPLYYGRYVDDVLLVMENTSDFRSVNQLWQWIFDRSEGKLRWADNHDAAVSYCPEYLASSDIRFFNDKNKVFLLSGESGKALVESIARQIYERASEWRALPDLPMDASEISTDLVAATQSNGENADSLRKTDALTTRRSAFAIRLRDFEAYERDLQPASWEKHRHAFLEAYINHVLALPNFFELSIYTPRVIKLATACEDFELLKKIIKKLGDIVHEVSAYCKATLKSCLIEDQPSTSELIDKWRCYLINSIHESIVSAFPACLTKKGVLSWERYMGSNERITLGKTVRELQKAHARLFCLDLAHVPFRFVGLPREMISQRGIPNKNHFKNKFFAVDDVPKSILNGVGVLTRWLKLKGVPQGLIFAVRPFTLAEIFIVSKNPFDSGSQKDLHAAVLSLRGYGLNDKTPLFNKEKVLDVPDGIVPKECAIAISSWRTRMDSWIASVVQEPDPDVGRYARLNHLINQFLLKPKGARYFVMPELSLPANWFIRVAGKLHGKGISLITGIEYLHATKGRVRNQVWAALTHDGLGFPSMMIYRQDKQKPALHEEQELQRLAKLKMVPETPWVTPPVIQHGGFRFSLVICSELTNISYRASLRGKVDALFVPEWNQDTESFNALVESAALDVHAYIIQCNDRQYGDSRIRAPHKEGWRRDMLRVKGGIDDYCVVGEIDIYSLREFQSSYRSPSGPFKPTPDGFAIDHERKVLPQ